MKSVGIDFELVMTEAPNHGTELAYQAVKNGFSPIISAGGDGSVSEVMNGIVSAAQEAQSRASHPWEYSRLEQRMT